MTPERLSNGSAAVRELRGVASRHRWLVMAGTAAGLACGGAFVLLSPPIYRGQVSIRVEAAGPGFGAAALPLPDLLGGQADVGTELEVLRSTLLVGAVVDSLHLQVTTRGTGAVDRDSLVSGLESDPRASGEFRFSASGDGTMRVTSAANDAVVAAAMRPGERIRLPGVSLVLRAPADKSFDLELRTRPDALRATAAALVIERPSRDANVLRVKYESTDRGLARDVPNAIATHFVALRQRASTTQAGSTARFLRQQLDTLQAQLLAAEGALQRFRSANQVVDLRVQGQTRLEQIARVQLDRGAMEAERSALTRLLADADREAVRRAPGAPSTYRSLAAFPALLRNQATAELLASLSRVEDARAALLTRRASVDPEVVTLTGRIEAIEEQLHGMLTTYNRALGAQISSLDGMLAASTGGLRRLPAQEMEFVRLTREPAVLAELYALMQTRLKEAEIAQAVEDPSVRVIDPATRPVRPVSPLMGLTLAATALLGLLAGLGVGYARDFADDAVHTRGDLELATQLPVLGMIIRITPAGAARLLPALSTPRRLRPGSPTPHALRGGEDRGAEAVRDIAGTLSPVTDAYDWLYTNLLFAANGKGMGTVLFTSAMPGEGKTTTAINLALTLAQRRMRVLLIDCDLRRGRIGDVLGASSSRGVGGILGGRVPAAEALCQASAGGGLALSYLPAGRCAEHPSELIRSERMTALLEWGSRNFDLVIVDTPPIYVAPDAAVLARQVSGVVVVARSAVTPFGALESVVKQLSQSGGRVLGTVLNDVDVRSSIRYDESFRWHESAGHYYAPRDQ